jgi:hypothetical protein
MRPRGAPVRIALDFGRETPDCPAAPSPIVPTRNCIMPSDEPSNAADLRKPDIVDPHLVPVTFVDWFVTGGVSGGVVNIVLGTLDHTFAQNPGDIARVVVGARLRLSLDFASRLHKGLGDLLKPGEQAQKSKLN